MSSQADVTKRALTLQRLADQAETLRESEGWRAWLDVAARFHSYSLNNQLLIASQRPDATRVAGFKTWLGLDRCVRKGERGIAILAPCLRKREDDDTRELVGFRVVHVFDVAQTDGTDLPELTMPDVSFADDGALLAQLAVIATGHGIAVESVPTTIGGARGWWDPEKRAITLVDSYDTASQTRTMLHELAHSLDTDCERADDQRAARELVAESVAYVVGSELGLDMTDASTFYVATWGADVETMRGLAARVLAIAKRLADSITSADTAEAA